MGRTVCKVLNDDRPTRGLRGVEIKAPLSLAASPQRVVVIDPPGNDPDFAIQEARHFIRGDVSYRQFVFPWVTVPQYETRRSVAAGLVEREAEGSDLARE